MAGEARIKVILDYQGAKDSLPGDRPAPKSDPAAALKERAKEKNDERKKDRAKPKRLERPRRGGRKKRRASGPVIRGPRGLLSAARGVAGVAAALKVAKAGPIVIQEVIKETLKEMGLDDLAKVVPALESFQSFMQSGLAAGAGAAATAKDAAELGKAVAELGLTVTADQADAIALARARTNVALAREQLEMGEASTRDFIRGLRKGAGHLWNPVRQAGAMKTAAKEAVAPAAEEWMKDVMWSMFGSMDQ